MTPAQQAALDRLVALMYADLADLGTLLAAPRHVREGSAADWEFLRAQRAVQADQLPGARPLVDGDLVTGATRDQLLAWLPRLSGLGITEQRQATWDDFGERSTLADAERVLADEGLTTVVERFEHDNGDVSVVRLHPAEGILAEVSTRRLDRWRVTTVSARLYCNHVMHDHLAHSVAEHREITDAHGPTGVWTTRIDAHGGVRVPLAVLRAFGEFVRPWRAPAVSGWFGGETAVSRQQELGTRASDQDPIQVVGMLEQLAEGRVAGWPREIHDLLGPIYANRHR
ncbi:hypothetical protein [Kutzneria chonburiensis]|uniref:Uncharacterized protein n=1 Tax=Kutzneria chonburiensis TaxID=1483604 RepID=A0ABV6MLA4_9PSEU|nr:hypothetical protein [Kutzneria chonburiensis]